MGYYGRLLEWVTFFDYPKWDDNVKKPTNQKT